MTKKKTKCSRCHKLFVNFKRHLNRKTPCVKVEDKVEVEIEYIPEVKSNEDQDEVDIESIPEVKSNKPEEKVKLKEKEKELKKKEKEWKEKMQKHIKEKTPLPSEKIPSKPYNDIPEECKSEVEEFRKKYPGVKLNKSSNSLRFQAISLILHNPEHYIDGRTKAKEFYMKIGLSTDDAIQPFNKIDQDGWKQPKARAKYSITYPFICSYHVDMRNIEDISKDKSTAVIQFKEFIKTTIIDCPEDDWQIGHRNPDNGGGAENLIYQPDYQAKTKDRMLFLDDKNPIKGIPNPNHECFGKEIRKNGGLSKKQSKNMSIKAAELFNELSNKLSNNKKEKIKFVEQLMKTLEISKEDL